MSKTAQKTAVIFDFFDVLHQDPLKAWCMRHGIDREGAVADIAFRLDTGAIGYGQYVTELAALNSQTPQELETEFASALVNDEMVELIRLLKTTHTTALLSNTNHEEIDPIFERHDLAPLFHEVVISSDVALAKPDPQIYQLMLDRLNVASEQAVFIDDNPSNVAAAQSVGIDAICYTDMSQLHTSLNGFLG